MQNSWKSFPAEFEVEIKRKHFMELLPWSRKMEKRCGCNTGRVGWRQSWRKPLRRSNELAKRRACLKIESEAANI